MDSSARRDGEPRVAYADVLRVFSMVAVVIGHWLAASLWLEDGRITGANVLGMSDWTHPFTWVFQVMALFFFVGGLANATSWSRARSVGTSWPTWLAHRTRRLLVPTAVFIASAACTVAVADTLGADPELIDDGAWLVGIGLWFLVVYVAVVAVVPLLVRLHRRAGVWVPLMLAAAVLVVDMVFVWGDAPEWVGMLNFGFAWLAVHQLGVMWWDGWFDTRGRAWGLAVTGGIAAVALTLGPYPMSMVGVPGADVQNTSPPTIALVAFSWMQVGLVLVLRPAVERWTTRPRPVRVFARLNGVVLTVYLWHMVPVVFLAAALVPLGLPAPAPLTGAWGATRPLWIVLSAVVLFALVTVLSPIERRTCLPRTRPTRLRTPRPVAVLAAVVGVPLTSAGLLEVTLGGLAGRGPLGLDPVGLVLFGAGAALLCLAGTGRDRAPEQGAASIGGTAVGGTAVGGTVPAVRGTGGGG